jgi:hypothetical protein
MKTRKWCDQNGVFKWCEQKKIPCSKNSDTKELLLQKVRMWQEALANGEVEPLEKPKRAPRNRRNKEKEGKKEAASKSEEPKDEDEDTDGKKRGGRTRGGARRNNRRDEGEPDGGGKRRGSQQGTAKVEEPKASPKPPPAALRLDDQVGLQEIAGGLRVASEGGMVVVESTETCEDDSGFTTEMKKKDKKDAQKEARAQQEKEDRAMRRRQEKENQKARQEAERTKKAAADKASAAAKAEEAKSASPASNLPQPMPQSIIQDMATPAPVAGAAPAKPAWGGQGQNKNETHNFHQIMVEEKIFKKAPSFNVENAQNFEVPAPHPPNVNSASGAIGGERKMTSDVPAADPWGNPNTAPAPPASFSQASFGGGAFSQSSFGVDPLHTGPFQTLTSSQGVAQFTALPSFSQGHYGNAFSAGASGLVGWGGSSDGAFSAGGGAQLPAEALPPSGSSGWSPQPNQKPVGPGNKNEGANGANAKPNAGGEKTKRNSRGGKGRGGKGRDGGGKGKGGSGGKGQDSKDGDGGKADQQGRNNSRGGRQNRRGGKADGGKGGHKSGDASASAPTVDAVVPNKSRRGGGGRNAKKSTAKAPE